MDGPEQRLLWGTQAPSSRDRYTPPSGSVVIAAPPETDRATAIDVCLELDGCSVYIVATYEGSLIGLRDRSDGSAAGEISVDVRDSAVLGGLFSAPEVVIDISCLDFSIWGPLINVALDDGVPLKVLYTEASDYGAASSSDGMTTIGESWSPRPGPIPSMLRLSRGAGGDAVLVALVGFEGLRLQALISALDPSESIPVVGTPGVEYNSPFLAVDGNRLVILSLVDPTTMLMADALSPFDAALVLKDFRRRDGRYFYVAPVGTQPHALGALLFWREDQNCQMLYDFPTRSSSYASGAGGSHLYDITAFVQRSASESRE